MFKNSNIFLFVWEHSITFEGTQCILIRLRAAENELIVHAQVGDKYLAIVYLHFAIVYTTSCPHVKPKMPHARLACQVLVVMKPTLLLFTLTLLSVSNSISTRKCIESS